MYVQVYCWTGLWECSSTIESNLGNKRTILCKIEFIITQICMLHIFLLFEKNVNVINLSIFFDVFFNNSLSHKTAFKLKRMMILVAHHLYYCTFLPIVKHSVKIYLAKTIIADKSFTYFTFVSPPIHNWKFNFFTGKTNLKGKNTFLTIVLCRNIYTSTVITTFFH